MKVTPSFGALFFHKLTKVYEDMPGSPAVPEFSFSAASLFTIATLAVVTVASVKRKEGC